MAQLSGLDGYDEKQTHIRGDLGLSPIHAIDFAYPERWTNTQYRTEEFTSVCPKTSLPDFAEVIIDYAPWKLMPELKSLKGYFVSYRDVGIFHENLVNRILEDFVAAVQPRWVKVTVDMKNRGGIYTLCDASWTNPDAPQGDVPIIPETAEGCNNNCGCKE